jgi:hypothetical protein
MFNQLIPALEAINYHKVKEDKAIIFYESSTAPTVVKLDYTNNNVSFTVTDTSIMPLTINSFKIHNPDDNCEHVIKELETFNTLVHTMLNALTD